MTPYPNYHFKEHKCFLYCHNNNYCFRQNFRTILHWHWHAFSWPLAPSSIDGKIITFLPSICDRSKDHRLHVVGRLLVVITSFCPSCEAALRSWGRWVKAFYRQGQRQQFQPHFTCGRLVALQCSIHNTIPIFVTLHVESIATTCNAFYMQSDKKEISYCGYCSHCKATSRPQVKWGWNCCLWPCL